MSNYIIIMRKVFFFVSEYVHMCPLFFLCSWIMYNSQHDLLSRRGDMTSTGQGLCLVKGHSTLHRQPASTSGPCSTSDPCSMLLPDSCQEADPFVRVR